ncbi:SET and MYND domain-containing protein 4 [Melipona quadrifasciata]|uniref:Protein-lysine N-methyltransferase SMYD4 n=1 Tax=Melipona quadrifasciata TaxID=166423 RepID=A0A0M9A0Z4_9HYME|nr:SET and MYND domain-containing protein 4 [Melipona quadrifasciata]
MSLTKGYISFSEFFKVAYNAAIVEPCASRFKELSEKGDREGMIKVLINIPCIEKVKIVESYKGKDDIKAAELYKRSCEIMHEETNKSSILTETLFKASVTSRLFLNALLDCAQYCYNSKAFVKCLKYCECMLALPENFYDKTPELKNDFLERRKACIQLERECYKNMKMSSSQDKRLRKKCNKSQNVSPENALLIRNVSMVPSVDGKQHATLKSCSDAVALQFDETRGRYLVATRNIKAGSVLIVETPFAFSTKKEALDTNCLHCHITFKSSDNVKIPCYFCQTVSFCTEKCRREAWQIYHQYECFIFDAFYGNDLEEIHTSHLLLAYRMIISAFLSSNTKEIINTEKCKIPFLNDNFLRDYAANKNKEYSDLGINQAYCTHDYRTILNLETHCTEMEPSINLVRAIEAIFLAKCFTFVLSEMDVVCLKESSIFLAVAMLHNLQVINCNAYEIVENIYDKKTHAWEPRHIGGAIYPSVSLTNHSCYPNVVRHSYPSGIVALRALRFIGKGTEILDCYGPHWLSERLESRFEYLWKKYRFVCACEACAQNWQYPLHEIMNFKCKVCSKIIGTIALNEKHMQNISSKQCHNCTEKIDLKKIKNQFRKSVEKRLNAISKMYDGHYEQALPQLLEHIQFIEKCLVAPNIETIKTQQCIIQCYNQFGCTSQ